MDYSRPRRVRVKGALAKNKRSKKLINQLFGPNVHSGIGGLTSLCSAAASHRSFLSSFSSFAPRHSSPATSALGLSSVPSTSPVGPLQRTALRKKLINQLFFCFHSLVSASKLAPQATKTKGVEFSTPFCFVCSLWELRDSKVEPLGSSSRGYH